MDQQEYLRYSWTICNQRSQRELGMGFNPSRLARNVIDNCLGDVFRFGVLHAAQHTPSVTGNSV